MLDSGTYRLPVSTHSRPKAAGDGEIALRRFMAFQHTAARRRLAQRWARFGDRLLVSTHSRPKAAGALSDKAYNQLQVSTHSRPKAAGQKPLIWEF